MTDNLKQGIVLTANDAVVYDSTIPVRKSWYENPDEFTNGYYPVKGGKRRNNRRKSAKKGGRSRRMFSKRKQYRGI